MNKAELDKKYAEYLAQHKQLEKDRKAQTAPLYQAYKEANIAFEDAKAAVISAWRVLRDAYVATLPKRTRVVGVEPVDETLIPRRFFVTTLDTAAVMTAVESGEEVPGVRLVREEYVHLPEWKGLEGK